MDSISKLQSYYLDYTNNFISVAGFAAHYGIAEQRAVDLIDAGRICHETIVSMYKE